MIINPLFVFRSLGIEEVGKKWGHSDKPYQKPVIKDFDGDLSKQWHVYYRYWDDEKEQLVKARKSEIPNVCTPYRSNNKQERYKQLGIIRDAVELLLSKGWTPKDGNFDASVIYPKPEVAPEERIYTIGEAIDEILRFQEDNISSKNFVSSWGAHVKDFKGWLADRKYLDKPATKITRRTVTDYLRHVKDTKGKNGKPASNRTRNNYLGDLASLFQKMIEEEMIYRNPTAGIQKLKEVVERHVAYTAEDMIRMARWMDQHSPYLKKFSYFIGYAFLRPSEIMRLQVEDVDLKHGIIRLKAGKGKTGVSKTIPIIDRLRPVIEDLLKNKPPRHYYLFSGKQRPSSKPVGQTHFFSRRFIKCRDYMNETYDAGFGENHDLYGMRHTFIQDLYRQLRKTKTKTEAEYALMPITRHSTVEALRKYIRDYSMELPEDWSESYSIRY